MEQFVITFDEIRALLVEQQYAESDIEELEKAFEFAKKLHAGQYRVSEEPYIIHPMEVVKILIGLRADKHTLMAGFLHDILEDTETKPEEIKEPEVQVLAEREVVEAPKAKQTRSAQKKKVLKK